MNLTVNNAKPGWRTVQRPREDSGAVLPALPSVKRRGSESKQLYSHGVHESHVRIGGPVCPTPPTKSPSRFNWALPPRRPGLHSMTLGVGDLLAYAREVKGRFVLRGPLKSTRQEQRAWSWVQFGMGLPLLDVQGRSGPPRLSGGLGMDFTARTISRSPRELGLTVQNALVPSHSQRLSCLALAFSTPELASACTPQGRFSPSDFSFSSHSSALSKRPFLGEAAAKVLPLIRQGLIPLRVVGPFPCQQKF